MIPCSRIFVLIWDPVQDWNSKTLHVPNVLTCTGSDLAERPGNKYPVQDKHANCIPCLRQGSLKTIPYPAAHLRIANIGECPPPGMNVTFLVKLQGKFEIDRAWE